MKFKPEHKPVLLAMAALVVIVALVVSGSWYLLAHKQPTSAGNGDKSGQTSQGTSQDVNDGQAQKDSSANSQLPAGESPLPSPQNKPTKPAADGQAAKTSTIAINSAGFEPANLTIKKGAAVSWTNKDTSPHAIAADDESVALHSPQLQPGQSYTYAFATAGTYHYHCAIAPGLKGTITVTN